MTGVYQPGVMSALAVRNAANVVPAPMQLLMMFSDKAQKLPTLILGFSTLPLDSNYAAGVPIYGGYTVGDYSLALARELKLSFLEAQTPPLPAGFSGQSALMDFGAQYFASQNFPPIGTLLLGFGAQVYQMQASTGAVAVGTPILPDPPYAIGFVTPGTSDDTRVSYLVLGEGVL